MAFETVNDTSILVGEKDQGSKMWASLFASNDVEKSWPLEWIEPEMEGDVTVVPRTILDKGVNLWKDHLVGYFIDKRMSFSLVKRSVEKEWKVKGGLQITTDGKLYYFKFVDPDDRRRILEEGPIFVAGRIMVIRQWSGEVFDKKNQITSVPIWVKCYDIPTQMWSKEGLSLIGSRIEKPKCSDTMTMKMERLDFARICVEIQADTIFPTNLKFKMGDGKTAVIGVEYNWKPQCCSNCNVFGHMTRNCQPKKGTNWVQREAVQPAQSVASGGDQRDAQQRNKTVAETSQEERTSKRKTATKFCSWEGKDNKGCK
ncbi:hypothetical protein AQUCO_00500524v1 [Aquilegia coerulea]|uniref:DUF4283 domain-containing protein n=1 Tax=Aquilegia coerulea TaxID=218851 RepID=A0A2G5ESA6_AQUCA|nr:hypothetical protein AQUCO_00500524v1 [Aquilegia coerulea]